MADSAVLLPEQIVLVPLTDTGTKVFTVTTTVCVEEQVPAVPVTVYVVVEVGDTDTLVPVRLPGCQVYEAAPPPVSVTVPPVQMVPCEVVAVTVGVEATATAKVCVLVQPLVVPVTVYVVFELGATARLEPGKLPGIQVYVLAPFAVSVVELPLHTEEAPETETLGMACTVIGSVVVAEQVPLVPVSVYVVEAAGVTVIEVVVRLPGCQVYVLAPLAVSVVDVPAQIVFSEADAATEGVAFTVTVSVRVSVQPPVVPTTV